MSSVVMMGANSQVVENRQLDEALATINEQPVVASDVVDSAPVMEAPLVEPTMVDTVAADEHLVVEPAEDQLNIDVAVATPVVTQLYEPRFVAPAVVYMASPSIPAMPVTSVVRSHVLPQEYIVVPQEQVLLPQVQVAETVPKSTFMWNGTEYASYDDAVEAMRMHLIPSVDVEESNVVDAYADSNLDVDVDASKPAEIVNSNAKQIRTVRRKKGCC